MQEMLIMIIIMCVSPDKSEKGCLRGLSLPYAANYLMQEMHIMIIIMCVSPDKVIRVVMRSPGVPVDCTYPMR